MRFYGGLLAAIAAVILVLFLLKGAESSSPSSGSSSAASATPAAQVAEVSVTPEPAPVQAVQATPYAAPVSTPAEPAGRSALAAALQQQGGVITGYAPDNGWVLVTVQGHDRNVLNDFLDIATRAGMRDIDVNYPQRLQEFTDRQGRMVYQNTYRIRF